MVSFTVVRDSFKGFLTAGHCVLSGGTVYTLSGEPLGHVVFASFPGDDFALVQLVDGWTPLGEIRTGPNTSVPVRGSAEAPIGATVCTIGYSTGWHCGTIVAKNQSISYPPSLVQGLTETTICVPADYVGPVMAGDQAQGIMSAVSPNCSSGGTSYFQPVNEVLNFFGLSLVTS